MFVCVCVCDYNNYFLTLVPAIDADHGYMSVTTVNMNTGECTTVLNFKAASPTSLTTAEPLYEKMQTRRDFPLGDNQLCIY